MSFAVIWIIALFTIAGVIIRPFKINEATWAVAGAVLLVVLGQLTFRQAYAGIAKGTDVYLFLTGMMLLAETAREEKLFNWLAAHAVILAAGSSKRLFLLIYLVGIVVTIFLSNDATAVVLTPAVAAAVRAAKVKDPLPFLLICAFIANAASFVLPISNPANLVIYGSHIPPLLLWLRLFLAPAICAIAATFFIHYLLQARRIMQPIQTNINIPQLTIGGKTAAFGIIATALVLLAASAIGIPLGLPTAVTGIIISAIVLFRGKKSPFILLNGISWAIIPLVGGLFVIVEALNKTGLILAISNSMHSAAAKNLTGAAWLSGVSTAFSCKQNKNLPAGLIAGSALQSGHLPVLIQRAVLVGIDLGPNLSVTGSLATILWLVALKREGISVSGWTFLKLGVVIMIPPLLLAIYSLGI
jgi:arsenical pump membrane protein